VKLLRYSYMGHVCRAPYELCQIIQVGNLRHNALFRRFISALTRGGPGGMPRPIEVHAHDPLRYVGDMLGWLHQVCDHIFFSYGTLI